MPNYVNARQAVAGQIAAAAGMFAQALTTLEQASDNLASLQAIDPASNAGTFLDSDFAGSVALQHYTAALAEQLAGPVLQALQQARSTYLSGTSGPTLGDVLRTGQRGTTV